VRAAAQVIDSFLLVVETGRISPDALLRGLAAGGRAADKLLGVVVNKARTSYSRAKHTSYVDEAHYRGHSSHVS
jgi:Mrp family chromosome partitioning ATPase